MMQEASHRVSREKARSEGGEHVDEGDDAEGVDNLGGSTRYHESELMHVSDTENLPSE